MIIASAVSYAAIRGITHGTRGGPGLRGAARLASESDMPRILDAVMTRDAVAVLTRLADIGRTPAGPGQ
jgi:hypothetical protein